MSTNFIIGSRVSNAHAGGLPSVESRRALRKENASSVQTSAKTPSMCRFGENVPEVKNTTKNGSTNMTRIVKSTRTQMINERRLMRGSSNFILI